MAQQDTRQEVFVTVGDGSVFSLVITHWPEGEPVTRAPAVLGTHWPPMGVDVTDTPPGPVEREFLVDLASEDSLVRFESDFGLYVSEKLPGLVAVHAALLHVDDAVVIVPGSSGVGKSSLCVAAMEAGWQVWSDEYCLISTTTGEVSGLALEPVSPGQVAMDLMANTVCARSRPEETFRATTALAKTVTGFSGHRGDIASALAQLRELLRDA